MNSIKCLVFVCIPNTPLVNFPKCEADELLKSSFWYLSPTINDLKSVDSENGANELGKLILTRPEELFNDKAEFLATSLLLLFSSFKSKILIIRYLFDFGL